MFFFNVSILETVLLFHYMHYMHYMLWSSAADSLLNNAVADEMRRNVDEVWRSADELRRDADELQWCADELEVPVRHRHDRPLRPAEPVQ